MGLIVGLYIGGIAGIFIASMCNVSGSAKDVLNEKQHVDHLSGDCPSCGQNLRNFGDVNYCWSCGQKLMWWGEII